MPIKEFIVVLGMHRSGTSALTGLLANLGFSTCKNMMPATQANPKGYFECIDITVIHDELLKELGSFWYDVRFLPKEWLTSEAALKAKAKLKSQFEKEFAEDDYCVFKDPRLCILLPLWLEIFQELEIKPVFIIITRLPNEVAASLAKRDKLFANNANLLYVQHLINAERYTRDYKRVVINFSDLLQDWQSAIRLIDEHLDLHLLPVPEEAVSKVEDFLAPDLKHFTMQASINNEGDFSGQLANNLYQQLITFQADDFQELNKLYTLYTHYLQTLEPSLSHSAKLIQPHSTYVAYSKLYWQAASDCAYHEAQSLGCSFYLNQTAQLLSFTFPEVNSAVSRLRFAISNRPGYFVLQDIKLRDAAGKVLWVWDKVSEIFEKLSQDIELFPLVAEQQLIIMVTGSDPQVCLKLPLAIFAKISKDCKLEVQLTAQGSTAGIKSVIDLYNHMLVIQTNLIKQVAALTADKALSLEKNTALADENSLLSSQNQECRDEIIRAQSQLELLKDLMLGTSELERL